MRRKHCLCWQLWSLLSQFVFLSPARAASICTGAERGKSPDTDNRWAPVSALATPFGKYKYHSRPLNSIPYQISPAQDKQPLAFSTFLSFIKPDHAILLSTCSESVLPLFHVVQRLLSSLINKLFNFYHAIPGPDLLANE